MHILFLNGSPKGKNSVTIKTAEYLEKRYPNHSYQYLNIAQQIKGLEKDFSKAKEALKSADLVVFCYPVYTFIAPYQVHRFIELLKAQKLDLKDTYMAQISTSKHFYDMTAQKFIEENCKDLGRYVGALTADMDDLISEKGQYEADCFFENVCFRIQNQIYTHINCVQNAPSLPYVCKVKEKQTQGATDKKIVVVTNAQPNDQNLKNMISDFKNACAHPVTEVNLNDFPFQGGCLGCMKCATSGKCVYTDGFENLVRNTVYGADGIVYAFTIQNHYTHSIMKCFDDRQFCNGHRTLTTGKATGYIISGAYSNEQNLQTIVEARANVSHMYFCGVASDEQDTEKSLLDLAKSMDFALQKNMQAPMNFYGVGGTKIFRDLVYLMQGLMQEDHKFYK